MQTQTTKSAPERPLSPHLGIYRWKLTMTMSILHRATGFALAIGLIPFTLWLYGAAYNSELYQNTLDYLMMPFGKFLLFGWTFAFFYHLLNGIRHLVWDTGRGFSLPAANASGMLVLLGAIALSAGSWACIYFKNGGGL